MRDELHQQVMYLLRKHRIFPQKRLGQHFLINDEAVGKICEEATISEKDVILEIGSGLGQLTRILAHQVHRAIALEFDPRLYKVLKEELKGFENIILIQADATRCDYEEMLKDFSGPIEKIKVIGNLPYNVAVPILVRLGKIRNRISIIIATLQRELAERFQALPGGKAYGDLSIFIQYFYKVRKVASLPAEAFYPRPKVMSDVIALHPLKDPPVFLQDEHLFFRLVRAAFSQRRKTLQNALKAHPELGISPDQWAALLKKAAICPQRRGETLSIGEFARLSNVIFRI